MNQQKIKKLLLTGGSGFVMFKDIKESQLLAKVLVDLNIPDSCIITENESRNTYENAVNTAKIIKEQFAGKRILIITSAIHIRRTRACFEKANLQADYFPVDERSGTGIYTPDKIIIPNSECLDAWGALLHEWVGMIIYKLNGYC
ncbi:MAG: YdcF family protein [Bacteroidetes bacterium]|nr:YdcF family protein [Bacteroidota bacterium]